MRSLNDFEKEVINRLMNYHSRNVRPNFASILDPDLAPNKSIWIDNVNNVVELWIDQAGFQLNDRHDSIYKIGTAANLIVELGQNGYLIIFQDSPKVPQIEYGPRNQGNPFIASQLQDFVIKDMMQQISLQTLIIGQSLINYVANDFRTSEEVHQQNERTSSRNNIRIAMWALIISGILSIVQIVLSSNEVKYAKKQVESEQDVRLVKGQIDSLNSSLFDIKGSVDSLTSKIESLKPKPVQKKNVIRR